MLPEFIICPSQRMHFNDYDVSVVWSEVLGVHQVSLIMGWQIFGVLCVDLWLVCWWGFAEDLTVTTL